MSELRNKGRKRRATSRAAARALDRLIVLNFEGAKEARRVRETMLRLARQRGAKGIEHDH